MRASLIVLGLLASLPLAGAAELEKNLTIALGGGATMEFVLIPAGSFVMGNNQGDNNERPAHKVTITKPFYLGKYEVTQQQWQAVMTNNPAHYRGPNKPVETVTWFDCGRFFNVLSKRAPDRKLRLPTEAEWEYACRAGTTTEYFFGDDPKSLADYTWFTGNAKGDSGTQPVGQKKPNPWGLHDMYGNVWEWCSDWYQQRYDPGEQTDPAGPPTGAERVLRGGAWNFGPRSCRSSARSKYSAGAEILVFGFRVVCEAPR